MPEYENKEEVLDELSSMDDDSTYIIHKTKNKKEPMPASFTLMGNGRANRNTGIASLDVIAVMSELSKGEIAVFARFRDSIIMNCIAGNLNPNIVQIKDLDAWTAYEKMALSKNYAHLEYVGVMKRIARGVYMINPLLVIPPKNTLTIIEDWERLGESDDN